MTDTKPVLPSQADESAFSESLKKKRYPMPDGRSLYFYTFGDEELPTPAEAESVPAYEDRNV